ncbi:hypothetical protein C3F09_02590, partial [candidate division GN15 bacterium]
LSFVIPEWIDRTGAPVLGIRLANVGDGSTPDTKQVTLYLTQTSGQPYHLQVPISIEGNAGRTDTTVLMTDSVLTLSLVAETGATITVDPDYDLFRRLYPEEVEPIISAVLGAPKSVFVMGQSDEPLAAAFQEFAGGVSEDSATIIPESSSTSVPLDAARIMLNPSEVPDYIAKQAKITPDSVTISGVGYPRAGHSFVLSGQSADGSAKCWVLLSNDAASLPRLGQLVPHYGKYSYLVFEGAKNVAKGQWDVTESPLRVEVR